MTVQLLVNSLHVFSDCVYLVIIFSEYTKTIAAKSDGMRVNVLYHDFEVIEWPSGRFQNALRNSAGTFLKTK